MKNDLIVQELEQIREKGDGILKSETVVKYAENPDTALHSCFTWDDGEAAHQYRLYQARQVIRVCITNSPQEDLPPMRVFVSLKGDRKEKGGGYRSMIDVLNDDEKRQRLLDQALSEAVNWQSKYKHLSELSQVFDAINAAQEQQTIMDAQAV